MLINRANLAIAGLASSGEGRTGCEGVRVTAGETVATNGHVLGRVTLPIGDESEFPVVPGLGEVSGASGEGATLPAALVKQLGAMLPKVKHATVRECARIDEGATTAEWIVVGVVNDGGAQVVQSPGTGVAFVDWRQVMPKADRPVAGTMGISARYLRDVCDAVIKGGFGGRMGTVKLTVPAPESGKTEAWGPIVMETKREDTGQEAVFLIMPCRL